MAELKGVWGDCDRCGKTAAMSMTVSFNDPTARSGVRTNEYKYCSMACHDAHLPVFLAAYVP